MALALQAATTSEQAPDALAQFMRCVAAEARSLEPSGEPATTIAEVAAAKCERLREPAADLLIAEFHAKPEVQQYEQRYPPSAEDLDRAKERRLRSLSESARSVALRVIVERRAQTRTN